MFRKKSTASHVKPSGSFRLNERHPLARSLVLCVPFNGFSESVSSGREIWTRDLGIIKSTSEQATPKYNSDRFGLWGSFDKSIPDGFLIENLPATFPCISATQPFTALAWLAKSGQVVGEAYNVIKRDDNVTNNDSILYLKDNDTIGCTHGGIDFASTATIANDEPGLVGSSWDGATSRLIVKGVRSGSAAVAALNSGITVLRIGFRVDLSVLRAYKGPLYVIYIFDRALSETETLLLNDGPFGLFATSVSFPVFKKPATAISSIGSSSGASVVSGVGLADVFSMAGSLGVATVDGQSVVGSSSSFVSSGSAIALGVGRSDVISIALSSGSSTSLCVSVVEPASSKRHVGGAADDADKKTKTIYSKVKKQSVNFLDAAFNSAIKEVYEKLTDEKVDEKIRRQAADIVRSPEKVNWDAINNDAKTIALLMALWNKKKQEEDSFDADL